MADVNIQNEGSIILFDLLSDEAVAWWDEHVQEGMTYCGWRVADHRPARDIIEGLTEAGFELEGN
jgi:hypothetical protein